MVNERQRLQTIEKSNQLSIKRHYQFGWRSVRWRWSHFRAPGPSREIVQENSHSATTGTTTYHDKVCKRQQKWLDDDRQHRQTTASNQQSTKRHFYLRLLATRWCKCHYCSCSTRGDIVTESFACQRYMTNQTDGSKHNLPCIDLQTASLPHDVVAIFCRLQNIKPIHRAVCVDSRSSSTVYTGTFVVATKV